MSLTTDKNDPNLKIIESDGQQKSYLVLSEEERTKEFIQPIRNSYVHKLCGGLTQMGKELAETYAKNPKFYSGTYCCVCKGHYSLQDENGNYNFYWDNDGTGVGEITNEQQRNYSKNITRVALELGITDEQLQVNRKNSLNKNLLNAISTFLNDIDTYKERFNIDFSDETEIINLVNEKLIPLLTSKIYKG